jgi:glycerol kinase
MNLTRGVGRSGFLRGCMEGVALRMGEIVERIEGSDAAIDDDDDEEEATVLVCSGSALQRNPVWRQMLADVTRRKVMVLKEEEATSRGVAVLMGSCISRRTTNDGYYPLILQSLDCEWETPGDGETSLAEGYRRKAERQREAIRVCGESEALWPLK